MYCGTQRLENVHAKARLVDRAWAPYGKFGPRRSTCRNARRAGCGRTKKANSRLFAATESTKCVTLNAKTQWLQSTAFGSYLSTP